MDLTIQGSTADGEVSSKCCTLARICRSSVSWFLMITSHCSGQAVVVAEDLSFAAVELVFELAVPVFVELLALEVLVVEVSVVAVVLVAAWRAQSGLPSVSGVSF